MVHGPDSEDVEVFSNLYTAMEWARIKGAEYHRDGVDCLGDMQKLFYKEQAEDSTWFQYGTNYHWVTFEKI